MATMAMASTLLLRAVRKAAAASRAATTASRSARAMEFSSSSYDSDEDEVPDDAKFPTDKDLESDEATWALYERWCKAFEKERDHAEMVRRFKIFRYHAKSIHGNNTYVPYDREEAAIFLKKRRDLELYLAGGEDVSDFDAWDLEELGSLADGGDPCLRKCDYDLLERIEKSEAASCADKDVTVE